MHAYQLMDKSLSDLHALWFFFFMVYRSARSMVGSTFNAECKSYACEGRMVVWPIGPT